MLLCTPAQAMLELQLLHVSSFGRQGLPARLGVSREAFVIVIAAAPRTTHSVGWDILTAISTYPVTVNGSSS